MSLILSKMKSRETALLYVLIAAALVVTVVSPFVGIETITPERILKSQTDDVVRDIFWKIRVPRVITAFCAGAALALSGMAFQSIFRNPLATPFTLGVSSGAAFGATLYLKLGFLFSILGMPGRSISAFIWSIVSVMLVYGFTRMKKGFSTATMLVAGVAVNFFFASMILFIQYISDFADSYRIIRWLMGGFEIAGYGPLLTILPFLVIGGVVVFFHMNELNLLTLGEDIAVSRGVDVKRTKTWLFAATSLMVGGVVSVCGPIGFVGMMSPHICRLVTGADHRRLAPAAFIFGGAFLVLCDTLSRTLIAPAEIPVGVITSLLGGPFFLWLLLGGSSEKGMLTDNK